MKPGSPTVLPSKMDKKWTNSAFAEKSGRAKLLMELVDLTGVEPVTS